MSGSNDHEHPRPAPPKQEGEPHKVDEKVQEEAAKERAEEGGYD